MQRATKQHNTNGTTTRRGTSKKMDTTTEPIIPENTRRKSKTIGDKYNSLKGLNKWLATRKLKRELNKLKKINEDNEREKKENHEKAKESIIASLEVLTIEHKGKRLTRKDVDTLSYEECIEIFKSVVQMLIKGL